MKYVFQVQVQRSSGLWGGSDYVRGSFPSLAAAKRAVQTKGSPWASCYRVIKVPTEFVVVWKGRTRFELPKNTVLTEN